MGSSDLGGERESRFGGVSLASRLSNSRLAVRNVAEQTVDTLGLLPRYCTSSAHFVPLSFQALPHTQHCTQHHDHNTKPSASPAHEPHLRSLA